MKKIKIVLLLVLLTFSLSLFTTGYGAKSACGPATCKGKTELACSKCSDCIWVKGATSKKGNKTAAYCRKAKTN